MSEAVKTPDWLARAAEATEFVATVCVADDLDGALRRVADRLGDPAPPERLAARTADLPFWATPAQAWSTWQQLRQDNPGFDVCIQPVGLPGKRLLICDMDMTIVAAETLDEVAAELGLGERIAAITARAMHGEIDFDQALRERIAMLAGHDEQVFYDLAERLPFNPGARELIAAANAADVHTVLISGGFVQVAERAARELGFDEVVCNRLEIENGRLTGRVPDPIVNADRKRQTLIDRAATLGIGLDQCCAIGDGANDRPMLEAAGLGIAYRGKPVLRAATDCHLDHADLDCAFYLMRAHTLT
ncbi:MAG: phosphoserine phosphatase SerB [Gammaproteobacteria bacterium]|nr:phosphoserine phosphatase SerB [Gammaproteobacteria bacterium]